MGEATTKRLVYIDNLRTFLTLLVVAHHAAQPYGPTGGEWPIFNAERAAILGPFFAVNAAFFMGLFFFISGYFLPATYDRKGPQQLLLDRLRRLGIPIVFFALIVFPPVLYILAAPTISFLDFFIQVYIQQFEVEVAHLWFLMHLLCYVMFYLLWRQAFQKSRSRPLFFPNNSLILVYILGLTSVTFGVRVVYPIDRWVHVLGLLPSEIAHLPQYVSLFVLGIVAYRYNWLHAIPTSQGLTWLRIGLGAALLRYLYSLSRPMLGLPDLIEGGGFDWRSLVWSFWEATICVGLCLGLLILFRERFNVQQKLLRILSANAYAVYLIHLLVILYMHFLVADLAVGPFLKFVLVSALGMPICFAFSMLLRKIPFIKFIVS